MCLFLLKVPAGNGAFHGCCGKGEDGEYSVENSHNVRSLEMLNVFSKIKFSSQIWFHDGHSLSHKTG